MKGGIPCTRVVCLLILLVFCLFDFLIVLQEAIAVTGRYFMHTRRMFVDIVGVLFV